MHQNAFGAIIRMMGSGNFFASAARKKIIPQDARRGFDALLALFCISRHIRAFRHERDPLFQTDPAYKLGIVLGSLSADTMLKMQGFYRKAEFMQQKKQSHRIHPAGHGYTHRFTRQNQFLLCNKI